MQFFSTLRSTCEFRRVINETFSTTLSSKEFERLVADRAWSLDSWIQACANHYRLSGKPLLEFFDALERHLYSDLRHEGQRSGIEDELVTVLDRPRNASREEVVRIVEFFEKNNATSSLLAVTKVLLAALEREKLPDAIISFNADTLLFTLIELYQRYYHYKGPPPYSHPKYVFKPVLRPLDSSKESVPESPRDSRRAPGLNHAAMA